MGYPVAPGIIGCKKSPWILRGFTPSIFGLWNLCLHIRRVVQNEAQLTGDAGTTGRPGNLESVAHLVEAVDTGDLLMAEKNAGHLPHIKLSSCPNISKKYHWGENQLDITGCPFLKILVNHPSDIQLIILIHIINRWGYPEYWLASKYSYYGQLWVISSRSRYASLCNPGHKPINKGMLMAPFEQCSNLFSTTINIY